MKVEVRDVQLRHKRALFCPPAQLNAVSHHHPEPCEYYLNAIVTSVAHTAVSGASSHVSLLEIDLSCLHDNLVNTSYPYTPDRLGPLTL
jgi:hypothetical protein